MSKGASKARLLIVDDTPNNLIALEAVLADYDILLARSGNEALSLLEKNDVDVILLDIQMPGMDGYETARRIKQIERGRNTPIIFITAIFKEDPHVQKGYEVGGTDYFTKPFNSDVLKLKINLYAALRQKETLLREKEKRIRELEETVRKLSAA
jgi:CheY-like chemotaxis protein